MKIVGHFSRQSETVDVLEFVIPLSTKIISNKIDGLEEFDQLEKK